MRISSDAVLSLSAAFTSCIGRNKVKKDLFGRIKISTVLVIGVCAVVAFMLWLFFNIIEAGSMPVS
jgi:hypothetical protein